MARRSLIVPWCDRTERAKGQRQPRPNAISGTNPRLHHFYKIVAEHLESFLAEARETHERALPQYVEREAARVLEVRDLSARIFASTMPLVRQRPTCRAVVQEAGRVPILQCATHVWDRRTFNG